MSKTKKMTEKKTVYTIGGLTTPKKELAIAKAKELKTDSYIETTITNKKVKVNG